MLSQVQGTDLVLRYSKCGPIPPGHLLAVQTLGPARDLMNQVLLTRSSGDPQAHECIHPSFHGQESRPGKLKDSVHTRKECLVGDKHIARPHCLRLSITSQCISELLSKLLFCFEYKGSTSSLKCHFFRYNRKITTVYANHILIPFLKKIVYKL